MNSVGTGEKKAFKLSKKRLLALAAVLVGIVAAIAVIMGGVISYRNYQTGLNTPVMLANWAYDDSGKLSKDRFDRKYKEKYDQHIAELKADPSYDVTGLAGGYNEPKWDAKEVAVAQFCLIYAGKNNQRDEVSRIYGLMQRQASERGANIYPKELPLNQDKAGEIVRRAYGE